MLTDESTVMGVGMEYKRNLHLLEIKNTYLFFKLIIIMKIPRPVSYYSCIFMSFKFWLIPYLFTKAYPDYS